MAASGLRSPDGYGGSVIVELRPVAALFRIATVAIIATGVLWMSALLTSSPFLEAFLYYTVLSNMACALWLLASLVVTFRDIAAHGVRGTSTPSARGSGAITLVITVTMLTYFLVLQPATLSLTDVLLHLVTPIMMILDWVLFTPKGRVRPRDPWLWALLPLGYFMLAFAFSAAGGRFADGALVPYPFMDVATLGPGWVAASIAALTAGFVVIGYLILLADSAFTRAHARRPAADVGVADR